MGDAHEQTGKKGQSAFAQVGDVLYGMAAKLAGPMALMKGMNDLLEITREKVEATPCDKRQSRLTVQFRPLSSIRLCIWPVMALLEIILLLAGWVCAVVYPAAAARIVRVADSLPDPQWYLSKSP